MAREVNINLQAHVPVRLIGALIQTFHNANAPVPPTPSKLVREVFMRWLEVTRTELLENQEEALDLCVEAGVIRPERLNLRTGKAVPIADFINGGQVKKTPEQQEHCDALSAIFLEAAEEKRAEMEERHAKNATLRTARSAESAANTAPRDPQELRLATPEEVAALESSAEERAYKEAALRQRDSSAARENTSAPGVSGAPLPPTGQRQTLGVGEVPYETPREAPVDPLTGTAVFKPQRPAGGAE